MIYDLNLKEIPNMELVETVFLACGTEYNPVNILDRHEKNVIAKFLSIHFLLEKKVERKEICNLLGYKDHTTIVHAIKIIKYRVNTFEVYKNAYLECLELLELRPLKKMQNPFIYTTSY